MSAIRELKCTACSWRGSRYFGKGILVEPWPECGAKVWYAELWAGERAYGELEPKAPAVSSGRLSQQRVNPVAVFLRRVAHKLISKNYYDAPLDQFSAAIVHRAEFLVLADELDQGPPKADWVVEEIKPTSVELQAFRTPRLNTSKLHFKPRSGRSSNSNKPTDSDFADAGINGQILNASQAVEFLQDTPCSDIENSEIQQNSPEIDSVTVEIPTKQAKHRTSGRPRKWLNDAERKATEREEQKPLIFPSLPEGVYRAADVLGPSARYRKPNSVKQYLVAVQNNRCFFCDRSFGNYIQKNAARPEPLRAEDEHFIPRRMLGSRKDENRHAVCHICNRLKSDFVFGNEVQCLEWLRQAWELNGYRETNVRAIQYLGSDRSLLYEESLATAS